MLLDLRFRVGGITVLVDDDLGAAQAAAVDDAGVIQTIGEDDVFFADQRRDGGLIGAEPRLDVQRILDAFELRHAPLELHVQIERARDRSDGRRADAVFANSLLRRFLQARMIGNAQIVVRAEVQHALAIDDDPRALRDPMVRMVLNRP